MTNRDFEDDPKEIKRLIEYHNCKALKNKQGEMGIKIPISCIHLGFNDGKAYCKIYETRPVVCKEYYCEKVIRKALEKLTDGIHI